MKFAYIFTILALTSAGVQAHEEPPTHKMQPKETHIQVTTIYECPDVFDGHPLSSMSRHEKNGYCSYGEDALVVFKIPKSCNRRSEPRCEGGHCSLRCLKEIKGKAL